MRQRRGPIFIGGQGRSGTTLLSLILDSHKDIKFGPELHFRAPVDLGHYITSTMKDISRNDGGSPDYEQGRKFIMRVKRLGVTPGELSQDISKCGLSNLSGFSQRCKLISLLGERAMEKAGKNRWGIKIMTDIRMLKNYHMHFKDPVFIHVIKDPRDNALGLKKVNWGPRDVRSSALQWVLLIKEARSQAEMIGVDLIEVNFNNLVVNTEDTLRELLDRLGESWDKTCLQHNEVYHDFMENAAGHPSAKQVNAPVDVSYIGKYKSELTIDEIRDVETIAGSYMKEFDFFEGITRWERPI